MKINQRHTSEIKKVLKIKKINKHFFKAQSFAVDDYYTKQCFSGWDVFSRRTINRLKLRGVEILRSCITYLLKHFFSYLKDMTDVAWFGIVVWIEKWMILLCFNYLRRREEQFIMGSCRIFHKIGNTWFWQNSRNNT